jgi:hypothetical protein
MKAAVVTEAGAPLRVRDLPALWPIVGSRNDLPDVLAGHVPARVAFRS